MAAAGVCRWDLACEAAAVQTVQVKSLDIVVPACGPHAKDHSDWVKHSRIRLNPSPEPEPECWCAPDLTPDPVPYCPSHGTPEHRGLEDL